MMGFPPPESGDLAPKQELPVEQSVEVSPEMKKDAESEEKKMEWSKRVDAIGREEAARRMPEVLQKARQRLAQLYELLPRDKSVSEKEIIDLIDHTDLAGLLPGMREKLAKPIVAGRLNEGPKAELIEKGVDALMIWIQGEAMDLSTQEVLERLRKERESFYSEAAVSDKREPSTMETEPSEDR